MTEQAFKSLANKKGMHTSRERKALLRECNRRLYQVVNALTAVQDSCAQAGERITDNNDELTAKQEADVERYEEAYDDLDALIEYLDNAETLLSNEVR
jgi:Mg2+ and Co2+ transporter CorA